LILTVRHFRENAYRLSFPFL
ncbi:TPA: type II toxin-antitoxin system RelE/ParE family toxin, partial [Neisseria meningitidis]